MICHLADIKDDFTELEGDEVGDGEELNHRCRAPASLLMNRPSATIFMHDL